MENKVIYEDLNMVSLDGYCKTYYARKRGKVHVNNDTVCQDYCLVENIDSNTHIVCVADGHGGEAYTKSDKGAEYACTEFIKLIKDIKYCYEQMSVHVTWLDYLKTPEFRKKYIRSWRKTVVDDYKKEYQNCNETEQSIIKKYGTTFLFAIYDGNNFAVGQLGDGAILLSNEFEQFQLFKRHTIKITSATSSLASNRAEYSFIIDIYDAKYFSSILLSTDGIYDKLDVKDSFSIYEKSLRSQVLENCKLTQPFVLQGVDLSKISKDDCTIAFIKTDKEAISLDLENFFSKDYNKISFKRYTSEVCIYEGEKNEKRLRIYVTDGLHDELEVNLKSVEIKKAVDVYKDKEKTYFVYEIPEGFHSIGELIDSGEHLEKRYWFNKTETLMDEPITDTVYSNEFWLWFYENIIEFEKELNSNKISVQKFIKECIFVSDIKDVKNIFILSNIFETANEAVNKEIFRRFLNNFSIIGKLSCGEITIPLYDTMTQGQNILELHTKEKKELFCKVIYNTEREILGIWNATNSVWNLENEKRKGIFPQGVVRLNKDHTFSVKINELENIAEGSDILDGYARYKVKLLRRDAYEKE